MAVRVDEKVNSTQGQEVIIPCTKCSGKTAHEVVVSLDVSGDDDRHNIQWNQHYQVIKCLGCKLISFRDVSTDSESYYQVDEDEWQYDTNEKLYPSRIEGRKDLGHEVVFLPNDTKQVYEETMQALCNNSPILAGIGLRALVETVCKEKKAKGKNLFQKIKDLENQKVLTPVGASVLHKIRTLGNAAAHEVKPHTDKQLALAMDIVEHLLKDVYILPKLADQEFEDIQ